MTKTTKNALSSYDNDAILRFWEACKKVKLYVEKLDCENKVLEELRRRKIGLFQNDD